jgi:hypothetical protein
MARPALKRRSSLARRRPGIPWTLFSRQRRRLRIRSVAAVVNVANVFGSGESGHEQVVFCQDSATGLRAIHKTLSTVSYIHKFDTRGLWGLRKSLGGKQREHQHSG